MFEIAQGRKALVTGGANGIGYGVAERLIALGCRVVIADVDQGSLDRAEERLDSPLVSSVLMDVSDETSVRDGLAAAVKWLDGLDTVINSAGVFQFRALEAITSSEWDRIIDINLKGTFLILRDSMPFLKASGRGRVVNIASDAGKRGFPLLGAYCASKFGVVGLTQAIAAEVGSRGVLVNAVCPGTVADTGMGRQVVAQKVELGMGSAAEVLERGAASFPLGRVGRTADVADAVVFLISESSGWITGESINIDGGSLAG